MMIRPLFLGILPLLLMLSACGSSNDDDGPSNNAQSSSLQADFHTLKTPPLAEGQIELLTVSTLPDTVTGGDVLMAVRGLTAGDSLSVIANGNDVSNAFSQQDNGEWQGLVEGLALGKNIITASSASGTATLTVNNHPLTGPVISGPHQSPFICRTEDAGLGAPIDENCSIETEYRWYYRSSVDQGFHELADPYAGYPPETQQTETADGRAVPYVVRVESATINRGIARIAVLDDPAARGPEADFDAGNWSHRILYVFGESCGVGYNQGVNSPLFVLGGIPEGVDSDSILINFAGGTNRLGKGDVVIHSTLSAFGVHCNPFVSMETTMMIKEHITEQYGLVEAMVGTNGSGAALQQYNAINNAPGLLSAAMPTATFADIASTAMTVSDCGLLQNYYANSALDWNDQKQAEVNGHNLLSGNQLNAICQSWVDTFFDRLDPTTGCSVPGELRYHPQDNPGGARCSVQDANINWLGKDPNTGFANRPLDNVGIQYGLAAFNAGTISFAEFADLNRNIGGLDVDGQFVAQRHAMSSEAAAVIYRVGQVIGRGAIAETPVMDIAPYLDLIPLLNIHESVRPFTIRARLREQTGQDVTQSIWRGVATQPDAYPVMADWLAALDTARPEFGGDHMQAVMASKPAEAQDSCVVATIGGNFDFPDGLQGPMGFFSIPLLPGTPIPDVGVPLRLAAPEDFDSNTGLCQNALPVVRTPRMVAGMPMSDDIIKCQLKPVDINDYSSSLSSEQLAELASIFPDGVCDFSKPAAEDVERSMIWPSVGGEQLHAPVELKWRVARSPAN